MGGHDVQLSHLPRHFAGVLSCPGDEYLFDGVVRVKDDEVCAQYPDGVHFACMDGCSALYVFTPNVKSQ